MEYFVVPVEYCDEIKDVVKPTHYNETLFALVTTSNPRLQYSIKSEYYEEYWRGITLHALFSTKGTVRRPDLDFEVVQPLVETCITLDRLRIAGTAAAGWWAFRAISKQWAINKFVRRKYVNILHHRGYPTGDQVPNL